MFKNDPVDMFIMPKCRNCKHCRLQDNIHLSEFGHYFCRKEDDNKVDPEALCNKWELGREHARNAAVARMRFLQTQREEHDAEH